ncbi:MAG: ROK family protein [Clostridia bacterium]|nr:ROK family protein [Clostridia bacterium]
MKTTEHIIGFDIGGTKCAVSLGKVSDGNLEIVYKSQTATLASPVETIKLLSPFIRKWKAEYSVEKAGVSCGGPLDSEKGIIISTPNLSNGWHGFNIVDYIGKEFGLKAKLENDANACAVAEWKFGAGRNTDNMIFLTFGTGLGAGLILNGKLYSGTNGNAGEVGHIRLKDEGPIGFNKAGSAEGFCSGNGIKQLAQILAREKGLVIDENITTKDIFERAGKGDEFYLSVIKESATMFGQVLAILIDLFNPQVIVTGGVFMRNYKFFMSVIEPMIKKESLSASLEVCKILPAEIGENIGDYAAIALATEIKE